MAIQKLTIEEFLKMAKQYPVLDVRSPGEYNHAQIPGAYSLPLFTDEERKVVGTTYKQQSREAAIKTGLDFFGIKMKKMVEEAEGIIKNDELKIKNEKAMNSNATVSPLGGGGAFSFTAGVVVCAAQELPGYSICMALKYIHWLVDTKLTGNGYLHNLKRNTILKLSAGIPEAERPMCCTNC